MKKTDLAKILFLLSFPFFFSLTACHDEEEEEEPVVEYDENGVRIPTGGITADSYFWGTWIRMDNGKEYIFKERYVKFNSQYYVNNEGNESSLTVESLGKFEKQSDAVMLLNESPLFRKGGANLEYSLRVVGFASSAARAAISSGAGGVKVTGTSENYPTHKSESETDSDGNVKLKAPVAGDTETIVITTGDSTCTATGLEVNNNGANMGTIPIVNRNDCSLKITGKIPAEKMQGGYLYSGKSYEGMQLTVENIGGANCSTAHVKITSEDSFVTVANGEFVVSTLVPGAKTTKSIDVSFGTFEAPYVDTGLKVEINISDGEGRVWEDFIPLRVFRGQMPITVSAGSTENNAAAALNGFIIYPDGNNKFFSVAHGTHASLYVPTFKSNENLMLVFSGATTSKELSNSTEMFYTVNVDTTAERKIAYADSEIDTAVYSGENENIDSYISFGERENGASDNGNDKEDTAYQISGSNPSFQAYLKAGDRDFYKISVDSTSSTYYGAESLYTMLADEVKFNSVTLSWSLTSGVPDNNTQLYKNGSLVAAGVKSPYKVTGLTGNTSYSFVLKSADNDEISSCVEVKTPVTPVFSLTAEPDAITDTSVILELTNVSDVTTTAYIFKNGAYAGVSQAVEKGTSTYTILIDDLKKGTSYTFSAYDGTTSSAAKLSTTDAQFTTAAVPPIIGKPRITDVAGIPGGTYWSSLSFTWAKCSGAAKYRVYEGTSSLTIDSISGTPDQNSTSLSYVVSGSVSCSSYRHFVIVPVDEEGNYSTTHATLLKVRYDSSKNRVVYETE